MIRRVGTHLAVIASYLAIALFHLRPLGSRLFSAIPRGNLEDALLNGWIVNWVSHKLVTAPWELFDANCFFPFPHALTYSAHLLPESLPAALLRPFLDDPVFLYNFAFLVTFVAAGWGTFLLVSRLTGDPLAAWVAGAFACWFPAKRWALAHVNTLAVHGVPFAMLALHRMLETPNLAWVVAAGVTVAAASLTSAYYSVYLPSLLLVGLPALYWAGTRPRDLRGAAAIVGSGLVCAVLMAPILIVYGAQGLQQGEHVYQFWPGAAADVADYLMLDSWLWGWITVPPPSTRMTASFLPGVVAGGLALAALLGGGSVATEVFSAPGPTSALTRTRIVAQRLGYGALAAATVLAGVRLFANHRAWLAARPAPDLDWTTPLMLGVGGLALLAVAERSRFPWLLRRVLARCLASPPTVRAYALLVALAVGISLGLRLQFFGFLGPWLPAAWLYDWFPVLVGLRAPFRAGYLASAFLAVLVGYGCAALLVRGSPTRRAVTAVLLVLAMQLEFAGAAVEPTPPPSPRPVDRWLAEQPGDFGYMELPQPLRLYQTAREQWRTVYHWKSRVTGHNRFQPPEVLHVHRISRPVLNDEFVDYLMEFFPVRYVLVDVEALGDPQEEWLGARLEELGGRFERERRVGDVVVLRPLNGGEVGVLRRRFPAAMATGTLRIELAEPVPAELAGARLVARLDELALGYAELVAGQRVVELPAPEVAVDEDLPWLALRLARAGGATVRVRALSFHTSRGQVYP